MRKGGERGRKGEKNMLKRCVRVSRAGSDWSTPLLTPFAPATWLDGSFLLRSRPLFWFIPSSFRELATRCFHGRIRLIVERVCLIYPVTRDWFNKIRRYSLKEKSRKFLSFSKPTFISINLSTSSIPFFISFVRLQFPSKPLPKELSRGF